MKVICINPKTYSLTKNKEYEILKSIDNRNTIINDNGKTQSYGTSLFEEPVPKIVESTTADVLESLSFGMNEEGVILMTIDGEEISFDDNLAEESTEISCGIQQISNINVLFENIVENVPDRGDMRQVIANEIIRLVLSSANIEFPSAYRLISTNSENNDNYPFIASTMSNFTDVILSRNNPSSGLDITLWVIDCN